MVTGQATDGARFGLQSACRLRREPEMYFHLHVLRIGAGRVHLKVSLVRAMAAKLVGSHLPNALPQRGNHLRKGPAWERMIAYSPGTMIFATNPSGARLARVTRTPRV